MTAFLILLPLLLAYVVCAAVVGRVTYHLLWSDFDENVEDQVVLYLVVGAFTLLWPVVTALIMVWLLGWVVIHIVPTERR